MNVKLMHGDCLELMKEIEPGSVDLVLADPPYGITANNPWDRVIPFEPMWDGLRKCVKYLTGGGNSAFRPHAVRGRPGNQQSEGIPL